jgi:hypothetical protein
MLQIMILIIFHSGGDKSALAFSNLKIPLKIEVGMEKANDPRSAILQSITSASTDG